MKFNLRIPSRYKLSQTRVLFVCLLVVCFFYCSIFETFFDSSLVSVCFVSLSVCFVCAIIIIILFD